MATNIPEQTLTLGFKLISSKVLTPAQQSEHWDRFMYDLETKKMSFGGGHDKHGFEGTITGKVTREDIIALLRNFARSKHYSILIEIPVIEE